MHQASVANLPGNSTVLRELSLTPLNKTSTQVVDEIVEMFIDKPVPYWAKVMDKGAFQHNYFAIFAAFTTTILGIALPWDLVEVIIPFLANLLVAGTSADFIINHYMPEFHKALTAADLKISIETKIELLIKGVGSLMKIMFAFLFQEQFLSFPILKKHLVIELGGLIMPNWNHLANYVTGFAETDAAVKSSTNVYPG